MIELNILAGYKAVYGKDISYMNRATSIARIQTIHNSTHDFSVHAIMDENL